MGYQLARETAVSPFENSVSISRTLGFVGRGLVGRLTNRNSCALGVDRRGFEKSARKKLLESAAKALKSLSGINLCAAFFAAAGALSESRATYNQGFGVKRGE
jgi:hypothetical protein